MQKGQVAVFIIVGIVALLIAGLVIAFLKTDSKPIITNEQNIRAQVENCLELTSEDAVRLIGIRGGYLTKPAEVFNVGDFGIAYLYYGGDVYVPTIEFMEKELSVFVDNVLPICLNRTDSDLPKTTTMILDDKVNFHVDWPIQVSISDKVTTENDFRAEIPLKLLSFYKTADRIVNKTIQNPIYIDQMFLLSQGMNITYTVNQDKILYTIIDISETYRFMFAVKVNPDE